MVSGGREQAGRDLAVSSCRRCGGHTLDPCLGTWPQATATAIMNRKYLLIQQNYLHAPSHVPSHGSDLFNIGTVSV